MKVFLFPGQGSQEVGMGAELLDTPGRMRDLVALAGELAGVNSRQLCSRGPDRELAKTQYLQPLLVAVSLGYCDRLFQIGLAPDLALGHSLGEISALGAVGVVSFEEAVRIAAKRGELMAAAAARHPGGMIAVLGSERAKLLEALSGILERGSLFVANDNAPAQLILSGSADGLAEAVSVLTSARVPCKRLAVAGPWHTPLMREAQREFASWLEGVSFRVPPQPLLMNVSATCESDPARIRDLLVRNLTEPVQWRRSMEWLGTQRPRVLFEIGPGRVLSGLARANGLGPETSVVNVNHERGVQSAAFFNSPRQEQ